MVLFRDVDLDRVPWPEAKCRENGAAWAARLRRLEKLPDDAAAIIHQFVNIDWANLQPGHAKLQFFIFQNEISQIDFLAQRLPWPFAYDAARVNDVDGEDEEEEQEIQLNFPGAPATDDAAAANDDAELREIPSGGDGLNAWDELKYVFEPPRARGTHQHEEARKARALSREAFESDPLAIFEESQYGLTQLHHNLIDAQPLNIPEPIARIVRAEFVALGGRTYRTPSREVDRKRRLDVLLRHARDVCPLFDVTPLESAEKTHKQLLAEQIRWRDLAYAWLIVKTLDSTPADELKTLLPVANRRAVAQELRRLYYEAIESILRERLLTLNEMRVKLSMKPEMRKLMETSEHHVLNNAQYREDLQALADLLALQKKTSTSSAKTSTAPKKADRGGGRGRGAQQQNKKKRANNDTNTNNNNNNNSSSTNTINSGNDNSGNIDNNDNAAPRGGRSSSRGRGRGAALTVK